LCVKGKGVTIGLSFALFHARNVALGKDILIGIREIESPEYSPKEIMMQVFRLFPSEVNDGTIEFTELPDIESVNYGRCVGYEIIEHFPPDDTGYIILEPLS
jgi:hypothetical protein